MRIVGVIPARLGSTRLPGKVLADLAGRPMVVRVLERARAARRLADVVVATDDARVVAAIEAVGGRALLTSPGCRNGTERVAEAALALGADAYVNVQGDEPLVPPEAIDRVAAALEAGAPLATLARPLLPGEAGASQVVKVVLGRPEPRGAPALYFSRSLVPFPRAPGEVAPLAHVGVYGYSAEALRALAALPETALERAEGLEQLRALWHGMTFWTSVGDYASQAVDTPADLERARALWRPPSPV